METMTMPDIDIDSLLAHFNLSRNGMSWSTGLKTGTSSGTRSRQIETPVNGEAIGTATYCSPEDYERVIKQGEEAFKAWRAIPAPKRGEIVRVYGNVLRQHKDQLAQLVSLECGKILQEGLGEVQEMIDICDFAVGLSRQLYGYTMQSERPQHRMFDQYQPLGIVGIISAFNFPVAVWAWNSMLAAVCGDVTIWKPSEKTPFTAMACMQLLHGVLTEFNVPEGVFSLVIGDGEIGQLMSADERVPLVSATGSTAMGKKVAATVGARLGKSLLELGGNNAVILTPSADLNMAIRSTVFGAAGTCGQRCTTTRRLIIHEEIYEQVKNTLVKAYGSLPIGNPLQSGVLVGPLIDQDAVKGYLNALEDVQRSGGRVIYGGQVLEGEQYPGGRYVLPTLVEAQNHYPAVQKETFAPILYLIKYSGGIENAIAIQNDVKQGLSSAVFTLNMREAEKFVSYAGSDCGIANINIGTSGAEIGGAFGGEKETGGGRESGSDSWKVYMRRQTNTVNYSNELPLAQGIVFELSI